MLWLWISLFLNLSIIPWITKSIALCAMFGISITTVILFKRVFNADFIFENGRISRKLTPPKSRLISGNGGDGSSEQKLKGGQTETEPDLYEPMEDSLGSKVHLENEAVNQLRKRLNSATDQITSTAAAAVNN